jgi:hypothetical protein
VKLLAPTDPPQGELEPVYYLVDRVIYDDDAPWPTEPNGNGDSLTRISSENYGDNFASWLTKSPSPGIGPVSGDFDADGDVDGDDFLVWQSNFNDPSPLGGDGDGDGDVDGNDFLIWQANFGSTLPDPIPGDFDSDNEVDGNDFLAWQIGFGTPTGASLEDGDADGDGDVDGDDFLIWQQNFGTGSGSGSAATLFEQVRAKRERTVDRVFDEFDRRSMITRDTIVDSGEPFDELVTDKLRRDRYRVRPWAGIR